MCRSQYFCMSFNDSELLEGWDAYTAGVIDVSLVRQLLRILRKRRFSNNRTAASQAGLDPSTVAKLENLKSWPDYDPSIGVILKMLSALDVPLPVFVASLQEIEEKATALTHIRGGSDNSGQNESTDPASKRQKQALYRGVDIAEVVGVYEVDPLSSPTKTDDRAFVRRLVTALLTVLDHQANPGDEAPISRQKKTGPRKRT